MSHQINQRLTATNLRSAITEAMNMAGTCSAEDYESADAILVRVDQYGTFTALYHTFRNVSVSAWETAKGNDYKTFRVDKWVFGKPQMNHFEMLELCAWCGYYGIALAGDDSYPIRNLRKLNEAPSVYTESETALLHAFQTA